MSRISNIYIITAIIAGICQLYMRYSAFSVGKSTHLYVIAYKNVLYRIIICKSIGARDIPSLNRCLKKDLKADLTVSSIGTICGPTWARTMDILIMSQTL